MQLPSVDPQKAIQYLTSRIGQLVTESLLKDVAISDLQEQIEARDQRINDLEEFVRLSEARATGQALDDAAEAQEETPVVGAPIPADTIHSRPEYRDR